MTRVHWVSNETPDINGQGGQRRQFFQIRELVAEGHEVRVVTLQGLQDDTSISGVAHDVHRIPPLHARGRLPLPWRRRRLRRRLAAWGDVVVVAHGETWASLSWSLPRSKPVVVDLHNVFSRWPFAGDTGIDPVYWTQMERRIRDSADLVTVVSNRDAAALPPGSASVMVLENGVDPKEWSVPPQPAQFPVIKLFGNWSWAPNRAGLEWFAREIWPEVHASTHATCEIAGTGVPPWISAMGSLTDHGRVENLQAFLSDAWAIAVPLPKTIGAPVKYAEALAVGVPVIATTQAAYGHRDLPVIADDSAAWIGTLTHWLSGDQPPAQLRPDIREQRLRRLSWANASAPLDRWLRFAE